MSTYKVLVSGFEPFGGMSINPTQELLARVRDTAISEVEVRTILLPVSYDECVQRVVAEVDRFQPDAVVSCGLYAGRTAITPERVAINVKDTMAEDPIADNSGRRPMDEPVSKDGADGLFATLPVRAITQNLLAAGIPAFVSNTAGTYICNNTLYGVLDHVRRQQLATVAGFIHFPASTEMAVDQPLLPSLPLDMMAWGLQLAIETVVEECRRRENSDLATAS
jgi:pyroglutamyl-peptidase